MEEEKGIEITTENDAAVITFKAVSMSNVESITEANEQIDKFIETNLPKKIVVDFSEVKFFSSQVLGMLLEMRGRLKEYNGQVVISSINPQLYRVFRITNLDKIFKFFPDKESAVNDTGND